MKIALPTKGNGIDEHFGHCAAYTVFTVNEQKEVVSSELIPSSAGCGCKSDIASVLRNKGVTVMIAGNMGTGAVNVLNNHGIKVYRGCTGDVKAVTEAYLAGLLTDSGLSCAGHEHHTAGHSHSGACSH